MSKLKQQEFQGPQYSKDSFAGIEAEDQPADRKENVRRAKAADARNRGRP